MRHECFLIKGDSFIHNSRKVTEEGYIFRPTVADSVRVKVIRYNKTLTVSNDLTGPFYVFVVTDPQRQNLRGKVFEGKSESNDATPSVQPIVIELPPPSDLQVDEIHLPGSAKSGEKIQIDWKVSNHGDNAATGQWIDAVYLSVDAVWDISDRPIGRAGFSGTLAPGERCCTRVND